VGDYYWMIKRAFHAYVRKYNIAVTEPQYIHGWANCLRPGQNIQWHAHGVVTAGNFAAFVPEGPEGTSTLFQNPATNKIVRNKNANHDLVMFDGMTHHRTTPLGPAQRELLLRQGSECRITTAFDIGPEVMMIDDHHRLVHGAWCLVHGAWCLVPGALQV
jgi:hypothetical protein